MISWQSFGHDNIKNILAKQLSLNSLAHAYLFVGQDGIGKKTLALELAKKILAVDKLNSYPDFHILESDAEITSEQALEFIHKLSFKPFAGSKKVAIINNAHNLNLQSSNALLKTLEEPAESTVIILVSGEGRLLKTIVSRCQVFNFQTFSKQLLRSFAADLGVSVGEEVLELSFGKISRLKKLSEDKEFLSSESAKIQQYQKLQKLTPAEKILAVADFADQETEELQKNLTTWLDWQAQNLSEKPKAVTKLQALADALTGLKYNYNKKLVLQGLFLKI